MSANGEDPRLHNIYYQMAESNFRQEQSIIRQEQSAQRMEELLVALTQNRTSDQPQVKAKIKAAKPNKYDGKPEDLRSFLLSLRVYFIADPVTYNGNDSDDAKVRLAMTYLEGNAQKWLDNLMEGLSANELPWTTWESFEKDFRAHFETSNRQDDAQIKLEKIVQNDRVPIETFFEDIEVYRRDSGYNDAALIRVLKKSLSSRLLEDMYTVIGTSEPTTYIEWKKLAIEKDHHRRNLEANLDNRRRIQQSTTTGGGSGGSANRGGFGTWSGRGGYGGWGNRGGYSGGRGGYGGGFQSGGNGSGTTNAGGSRDRGYGGGFQSGGNGSGTTNAGGSRDSGGQNASGGGPTTNTRSGGGQPTQTSTQAPASGTFGGAGVPMEIDRARGGMKGTLRCYNCDGEGHFSRNCPQPKRPRQAPRVFVRTMFDNLSDDDKKGLLNELGFPTNEDMNTSTPIHDTTTPLKATQREKKSKVKSSSIEDVEDEDEKKMNEKEKARGSSILEDKCETEKKDETEAMRSEEGAKTTEAKADTEREEESESADDVDDANNTSAAAKLLRRLKEMKDKAIYALRKWTSSRRQDEVTVSLFQALITAPINDAIRTLEDLRHPLRHVVRGMGSTKANSTIIPAMLQTVDTAMKFTSTMLTEPQTKEVLFDMSFLFVSRSETMSSR
ncbi:hypothetical protein GALMADRAFT_208535 [Galerina marginata CBS 339.88]|uniref:CCHC-type domain-containing protein n=1 Tax=Galerina marginata (strain CBS 339.88) TaxID=685588 RepID=A0A067TBA0_GALM3|nr:hypothetical protein GALMADRAFT_208535 [Galerina marginata CBS 339.88]